MIKNLIFRIILIFIIFSSILSIYRQIMIIRTAKSSVYQLDAKVLKLDTRNNALQQAIK